MELVAPLAATWGATAVSRARLAVLALALAVASGITLGLVVHAVSGSTAGGPGLPAMHGQASWAPGERRAPSFALRDQRGELVALDSLRGKPVLLAFFDSRCKRQCPLAGRQLGGKLRRMAPAERPVLLIVGVNPGGDTRASIRRATREWGLAGPYRWHWLRGAKQKLARVWRNYGVTVRPGAGDVTHTLAVYLIDRRGFERTGYLFPFLPNFIELDLRKLVGERAPAA